MGYSLGRSGQRWLKVSAQVKAEESLCWLCGKPIDKSLPRRHRLGFTVDHVVPLLLDGPELERSNLRAAHMACNSARSNRLRAALRAQKAIRTSQRW
jgi:5-methylcytosine-specific restriction endonuclease McrA